MDDQEYREQLAHDVAAWRREGLITEDQQRAIFARAGMGEPRVVGALRMGWLVTAVSIVGAFVLAAGVVLFFASNWEQTPDALRVGLVFASMLIAYAIGYALIYEYGMQRVGSALLLLGTLIYEAGLFLLAQIYNMPVDSPWLFLFAAIGTFPLAYLFESRIVLLLAIANTLGWVIAELITRYRDPPQVDSSLLVIGAFGVALYAAGRLHALRGALARFGDVYIISGVLVVLGLIYAFTFDEMWEEIIDEGVEAYAAPGVVYVSMLLAGALVGAQWLLRPHDPQAHIEAGAQATLLALAAVVATWPEWTGYALVFNAAYFALVFGLVVRGYLAGDERYINLGLAGVAIGIITRYIDVFWSQLADSAFFIVGGMVLLGVAFAIERARRTLIAGMNEDEAPPSGDVSEAPA